MQQTGNTQQFSPEAHRDYLQLLARLWRPRRLNRKFDASDLVQIAQLKAFEKADQFRGNNTAQYKAWLRQVLLNTLRDELRKDGQIPEQSVRSVERSAGQLEGVLGSDGQRPSVQVALQEDLERMAKLLAGLPDEQQDVLVLKHCLGWKVADIAAELGRTKQSIAGLLRRGLQQMREKMAGVEK